jgi:hypothetical protein
MQSMSSLRSMSFFQISKSASFFKFSNQRPILKFMPVSHFLKSTPNDVTDVCPNPNSGPNPSTNQ